MIHWNRFVLVFTGLVAVLLSAPAADAGLRMVVVEQGTNSG